MGLVKQQSGVCKFCRKFGFVETVCLHTGRVVQVCDKCRKSMRRSDQWR